MRLAPGLKLLARPPAMWEPIGLAAPQQLIEVRFCAVARERDVTQDHAVVSLQPLQVAVGQGGDPETPETAALRFLDRASGAELGELQLRRAAGAHPRATGIWEVTRGSHDCLPMLLQRWHRLLRGLSRRQGNDFSMADVALEQLNVFYLCPRPVVLVSVDDGEASNLFPMDLIGPLGPDRFSLALRRTSPSIETLRRSLRLAMGDVAAADRDLAYRLGEHHRMRRLDWSRLSCSLTLTHAFRLPLPMGVLRTRECVIEHCHETGSHAWFLCRVVSDERRSAGEQLFHTSGIHRRFRERARTLPWSTAGLTC
jgi:flavin reductase (DIM6/NTAB) family NADH-FMN oxidoreductase RutF